MVDNTRVKQPFAGGDRFRPRWLWGLIFAYCAFHLFYQIFVISPVPFWDEWDHFVLLAHDLKKSASLAEIVEHLWIPDSVHRVPILKSLYVLLQYFPAPTKWIMTLTLTLLITFFIFIWRTYFADEVKEIKSREDVFFFATLFFFFCMWSQAEVFFMGMAIAWFIANFTFALALHFARKRRHLPAILLLIVNMLTQGTWVLAAATIMTYYGVEVITAKNPKDRRYPFVAGALYGGFFLTAHFLIRFHMERTLGLGLNISNVSGHLFAVFGSPFQGMGESMAVLWGVFFVGLVIWLMMDRGRREKIKEPYFIVYAIFGACVVTAGRSFSWKWIDTVALRYSTFMIMAWIMIFHALWRIFEPGSRKRILLLTWMFIAISVVNYKQIIRQYECAVTYTEGGRILLRLLDEKREPTAAERDVLEHIYPIADRVIMISQRAEEQMSRIRKRLE